MTYDSESGGSDKSSNSATDTNEEAWSNGCRDLIIIDKLTNSTSYNKEHKLSYNNIDKALHDAHLLNTLRNPSKMVIQTKSKKRLKCLCFSFFLNFVWITILDGLHRVFNRWASCNFVSKLFELSLCSLMLDVLLFNLSMIIKSLQLLF